MDTSRGGFAMPADARRLSSSSHSSEGRFIPGFVLAGRYRILGLLGRGGMGEVYRADDLKLGQAVALKFLPKEVADDGDRLARLLAEVKIARQVSHPNVCRVYDVGESDGHHFLAMEYVDGEDLASLLRRIGCLPKDKAIQIARQLCAGLAAAHEQGILHRDLKPANVMIDGRGRAKITDFGLASVAEDTDAASSAAGTPAYMAPEQLSGQSASVRSDVYALGLVLYELFTGRRPFAAATPAELVEMQQHSSPSQPSSFIDGFDPAVERVILRCLEKDPRDRPSSPLAVAAALPGGDPLAAALAAGETPSPELVAAAGEDGALRPAHATILLAFILTGVVAVAIFTPVVAMLPRLRLEKPPEVLVAEAQGLIRRLGYDAPARDRAQSFGWDYPRLLEVQRHDQTPGRWDAVLTRRPAPLTFWYRDSPRDLVTLNATNGVDFGDPPATVGGMRSVRLDARGDLLEFIAVPPERDESYGPPPDPDWSALLEKSGLDRAQLKPSLPVWNPPVSHDSRAAWDGVYPQQSELPVHVEAAAYRGAPVYFRLVYPWTKPGGMESEPVTTSERIGDYGIVAIAIAILGGGLLLARRNLRLARGDRRGAYRLAVYIFVLDLLRALMSSHHVASVIDELSTVFELLAGALFLAGLIWVAYIAIEPYARRSWPTALIGWSRLVSGKIRDPRIGRDVLIGGGAGVVWSLSVALGMLVPQWLGLPSPQPNPYTLGILEGVRGTIRDIVYLVTFAPLLPVMLLLLIVLLQILLRRRWAAVVVLTGVLTFLSTDFYSNLTAALVSFPFALAFWGIFIFVLVRYGLLAAVFAQLLSFVPIYSDFTSWYAGAALVPTLARLTLVAYGFHISRGARAVFQESRVAG